MKEIQAIGVYCSSYNGLNEAYKKAAQELGEYLAHHQMTMIYGGGREGLMGDVSNAVMTHGGRVIGFMPHHLTAKEEPNKSITELHMVDTMHTRKRLMFEHADAFVALPGGFGTLDETFEMITWSQLKLHEKPIIFVNINDYWTPLKEMTQNIFSQGFAKLEDQKCFTFVSSIPEIFQTLLKAPEPPSHKPAADWV